MGFFPWKYQILPEHHETHMEKENNNTEKEINCEE